MIKYKDFVLPPIISNTLDIKAVQSAYQKHVQKVIEQRTRNPRPGVDLDNREFLAHIDLSEFVIEPGETIHSESVIQRAAAYASAVDRGQVSLYSKPNRHADFQP